MTTRANEINHQKVIQITVDDRETNAALLSALRESEYTDVCIRRLPVGDYLLSHFLVERKSIADLCASIKDGRLFRQATQLTTASVQPVIILEGTSANLTENGLSREAIQGALITLALIFRIPLLRSRSPEETAQLILYAAKQIDNTRLSNHIYPRPSSGSKSLKRKQKMQIHVLQGFPGIGPVRSKQLINKFGTLAAIFNASPKELAEVPGMGKNSIKRILYLLN